METLKGRMLRAAKLDGSVFTEIAEEETSTRQAATVVGLAGLAMGLPWLSAGGLGALVATVVNALVGWVVAAGTIHFLGARLVKGATTPRDFSALLRATGLAFAPGCVAAIGIVPGLAELAGSVATIWILVALVVAMRQSLGYASTGRAVGVTAIGFIGVLIVQGLFGGLTGSGGGGFGGSNWEERLADTHLSYRVSNANNYSESWNIWLCGDGTYRVRDVSFTPGGGGTHASEHAGRWGISGTVLRLEGNEGQAREYALTGSGVMHPDGRPWSIEPGGC